MLPIWQLVIIIWMCDYLFALTAAAGGDRGGGIDRLAVHIIIVMINITSECRDKIHYSLFIG